MENEQFYKEMFLKQDIEEMEKKIKSLTSERDELVKALEFYASLDSWEQTKGRNISNHDVIKASDVDNATPILRWRRFYGGKLARETLDKINWKR